MPQTEIFEPLPVLDNSGRPQNFGWARSPFFVYEPDLVRAPVRGITGSDRYVLISATHMVVLEILDDGYFGYMGMSVVSIKDRKRSTQTFKTPFSLGRFNLPPDSEAGSIRFVSKKNLFNFAVMNAGVRIIKVDIPKFGRRRSLRGEVVLSPPKDAQSIFTNKQWRGSGSAFCCTRYSPWYSVEGVIQFGSAELVFTGGNAWGIYEWNRGVRPRSDIRFWAAGSGQAEGHQFAFTAGYDSSDSALGTGNAFFIDGILHKLDQVSFHISTSNSLDPWRFTSNDNRLEMVFSPHQERGDSHQMFLYSLRRRQYFGSFSGKVILDDGSELVFKGITGFAERRKSNR